MKTRMKSTTFLCALFLALPLVFSSCSNNDDGEDKDSIIGTWVWTATSADITGGTAAQQQEIKDDWVHDPDNEDDIYKLTFFVNGKMTDTFEEESSYSINGSNITLFDNVPYIFSLSGNTLILTEDITQDYTGMTKVLIHYTYTR
ncbi:lipocalin family protein [Dysgonomonas reticulitermitis]